MNRKQSFLLAGAATALLAAGVGLGLWLADDASGTSVQGAAEASPAGEREVLYWYDPMVPDQHFDKPGKSPFMDMALVPKYADAAGGTGIVIDPGVQQNLGIRTVTVEPGQLSGSVSVPGTIGWDLRLEEVVSARVDMIVDRVYVESPYERVEASQPLARILAPTWSSALAEAQALGNARSDAARALLPAARERLHALGLPPLASTGSRHIVLRAPADGVLSEIMTRSGATAPAGTPLFRINGTRTVWLEAALPQADIGSIAPGTPVEARVSAYPGRVFTGVVDTLLPQVEAASRTRQARIVLENPGGDLTPGMFAQVSFGPTGGRRVPVVPSDAVIGGGEGTRVIVMRADGGFDPVAVRIGRSAGGFTEILAGLDGGEQVVASGQFLVDSEASLSGALDRLEAGARDPGGDAP